MQDFDITDYFFSRCIVKRESVYFTLRHIMQNQFDFLQEQIKKNKKSPEVLNTYKLISFLKKIKKDNFYIFPKIEIFEKLNTSSTLNSINLSSVEIVGFKIYTKEESLDDKPEYIILHADKYINEISEVKSPINGVSDFEYQERILIILKYIFEYYSLYNEYLAV